MISISYIITVYNKEQYIKKVIESLLPSPFNIKAEYIIINDGSTDKSLEVIKENARLLPNVTILSSDQKASGNEGPSVTINRAIYIARGDYIFFLDGDHIMLQPASLLLLHGMSKLGADVGFCYGPGLVSNCEMIYELKPTYDLINDPLRHVILGDITNIDKIGSSGSMVLRDTLIKVGGADLSIFVHNYSLSLRLAKVSKFVRCNATLFFKQEGEESHHLRNNKKFYTYSILQSFLNFIEANPEIALHYIKPLYHRLCFIESKHLNFLSKIYKRTFAMVKYKQPQNVNQLLTLYKKAMDNL